MPAGVRGNVGVPLRCLEDSLPIALGEIGARNGGAADFTNDPELFQRILEENAD